MNPTNCTFGVGVGMFLGFMLTDRGIKANPDKCVVVLEMKSLTNLKEVQRLVGRITSRSQFIPKLAERIRPVLRKMEKGSMEKWDTNCERAFAEVKDILTCPLVMNRPVADEELHVYLGMSDEATSVILLQEKPELRLIYFVN